VRWETEQSFDGKLCQKYSCQKLSNLIDNLIIGFQVTVNNVGDVFFETQYYYILLCWRNDLRLKNRVFCSVCTHVFAKGIRLSIVFLIHLFITFFEFFPSFPFLHVLVLKLS